MLTILMNELFYIKYETMHQNYIKRRRGAQRATHADTKCPPAAPRKQAKRACIIYI